MQRCLGLLGGRRYPVFRRLSLLEGGDPEGAVPWVWRGVRRRSENAPPIVEVCRKPFRASVQSSIPHTRSHHGRWRHRYGVPARSDRQAQTFGPGPEGSTDTIGSTGKPFVIMDDNDM